MNLNQIETDFIEFISKKRNQPYREIEQIFLVTKNRFKFYNSRYRELCDTVHNLFKILYDDVDEKELIDSYKFHALMHLFRFISYSYPKSAPSYSDYLKYLKRILIRRRFDKLKAFIKRKISKKHKDGELNRDYTAIAKFLVEKIKKPPIVIDYGCGLGYISFEIGKKRNSKIYLVDIDCLTLEFAEFRFKKHGINVEIIPISKNELYPKLPAHNICIATEVMEHIMEPLRAYQNIYDSLEPGGILYGDFKDNIQEMLHVSPNLSALRKRISKDFQKIGNMCYKRVR